MSQPLSVRGKRAFVTGATGFLGYALCHDLLQQGASVSALSRNGKLPGDLHEYPVDIIHADLLDYQAITTAMSSAHFVFHVAADVRSYRSAWADVYRTNVEGTRLLVDIALQTKPLAFVYTSSGSTLGKPINYSADQPVIINESSTYNLQHLNLVYPHTKWLGELEVLRGVEKGLNASITHPTAIFGPWDFKNNFLPLFQATLNSKGLFAPPGFRTTCDVRDVARAHISAACLARPGERYALGGESLSLRDLFSRIARLTGGRPPIATLPANAVRFVGTLNEALSALRHTSPTLSEEIALQSTFKAIVDCSKAQKELGYSCRPLDESLHDAVTWYRQNNLLPH